MNISKRTIPLPSYAEEALSLFSQANIEAWVVGGYIRDALLNRPSHDVDIATECSWEQTKAIFEAAGWRTHEVGIAHGTITIIKDDHAIEVTTYRNDGIYLSDARHPKQVTFVSSIAKDLARRDFTINALAYHPERGLLDMYHGIEDLQHGIICAVGDPEKRFAEDALRILRGCRFAAQLGFDYDSSTFQAMIRHKGLLAKIAAERVTSELDRLLVAPFAGQAIGNSVDILSVVLPELVAMKAFDQCTPYHIYDVLTHTCKALDEAPATRRVRWATLCHDMGKPATFFVDEKGQGHFYGHPALSATIAQGIFNRLMFEKAEKERILQLIRYHDTTIQDTPKSVRKMLHKLNDDPTLFRDLLAVKQADTKAQAPEFDRTPLIESLTNTLNTTLDTGEPFALSHLPITGLDILALGIPKGPLIGEALNFALNEVLNDTAPNQRGALLEAVNRWWQDMSN